MAKAANFQHNTLYHLDFIMHDLTKSTLETFRNKANYKDYNLTIYNKISKFIPKNISVSDLPENDTNIEDY